MIGKVSMGMENRCQRPSILGNSSVAYGDHITGQRREHFTQLFRKLNLR